MHWGFARTLASESPQAGQAGGSPSDVPGGGVDALGVTLDPDGNVYFGPATPDYSNAYRLKDGGPRYDIKGERGKVLKLSPDRKRRDVVATGIRFPYALRFNRHGDLFSTDQEGETWLPGGNSLDELNHVVPGRHYDFPPRHKAYLPGVIDEPPGGRLRLAARVHVPAGLQGGEAGLEVLRPGVVGRGRLRARVLTGQALAGPAGEAAAR